MAKVDLMTTKASLVRAKLDLMSTTTSLEMTKLSWQSWSEAMDGAASSPQRRTGRCGSQRNLVGPACRSAASRVTRRPRRRAARAQIARGGSRRGGRNGGSPLVESYGTTMSATVRPAGMKGSTCSV